MEEKKGFVADWTDERWEVRTRMSVRRFEEEYASRRSRHWMSAAENEAA